MAQHFLLSAKARDFDREEIDSLNELGAIQYLAKYRWPDGKQKCPACRSESRHKFRKHRLRWCCNKCSREFSVTSGTVFQDRKMPVKKLLQAIFTYSRVAKGNPALALCGEVKISYVTAWLLCSKLREVLLKTSNPCQLSGLVHVDGGYFGGKPRSINNHGITSPEGIAAAVKHKYGGAQTQGKRRYRNLKAGGAENERKRNEMRRLIYVFRQVDEHGGTGAMRTIVAVVHRATEVESDASQLVQKYVALGSTVMTDESSAYRRLNDLGYKHFAVTHKKQWRTVEGVNNNQAESFFARMRRAEYGVFHRYTPTYLKDYANEFAWREDSRRKSYRERYEDLLFRIFLVGRSQWFRGYHQENYYIKASRSPTYQPAKRRPELLDLS
ncbi:MAG TPA: IS1595 family transposase [Rhodocyclaceae bacterium]|nr:IS1595 family transposase [Rhodocyclaceae bacterium]